MPSFISNPVSSIEIKTFARLHMGFFDLNGGLGRRFGSIGLSLQGPCTVLSAKLSDEVCVAGPSAARAEKIAKQILAAMSMTQGVEIAISEAIPEHAGLGSGTQMALAVGTAISQLYGLNLGVRDIANITARGARSGIGLGTFDMGGVIVDGGRGHLDAIPPVISHMDFPEAWRVVLIFDDQLQGVHGVEEVKAFKSLPTFPDAVAADLCRRVLMQALPALAEADLVAFGEAICALQAATGDYFAPIQGGRYASPAVAEALEYAAEIGVHCYGQSSWGPTGFAIVADEESCQRVVAQLEARFINQGLVFKPCAALNRGSITWQSGAKEAQIK